MPRRSITALSAPAAILTALLAAAPAFAADYTVKDIGIGAVRGINASGQATGNLTVGNTNAYIYTFSNNNMAYVGNFGAKAINDNGQLAGATGTHVIFYDGQMHDLGTPLGGTITKTNGMNNAGYIVGQETLADGTTVRGFVYDPTNPSNGGYTQINTLSGVSTDYSYASGINSSNQVEGDSQVASGTPHNVHAFIWLNGQFTVDVGTFGGPSSSGTAINDLGHSVGTSQTIDSGTTPDTWISHVFLYRGSLPAVDCGTLGGKWANAGGLNELDVIVGRSTLNPSDVNTYHAFIYANGVMSDLNNLIPANSGYTLTSASGINDFGQIVAQGTDSLGNSHALFLNPTPEPSSLSLLALGGMTLLVRRRR